MHRAIVTGAMWLTIGLGAGSAQPPGVATKPNADAQRKWEYRVLTKDELPTTQAKDLAAALNRLGDDGWELVAAGSTYIFKRPKNENRIEELRRRVRFLETEIDKFKDRVTWSKRMARKGFFSDNQLQFEEDLLKQVEDALDKAKADLKTLPADKTSGAGHVPK